MIDMIRIGGALFAMAATASVVTIHAVAATPPAPALAVRTAPAAIMTADAQGRPIMLARMVVRATALPR